MPDPTTQLSALLAQDRVVGGPELAAKVDELAAKLGQADHDRPRTIVAIGGVNSIEWVAWYLAVRQAGHVALPLPAAHLDALVRHHHVGLVVRTQGDEQPASIEERHREVVDIHTDLALMLGTSGSTGTPKL
ncbi:MAG: hypothetical protein WEB78_03795, partial [Ilumatobacteraceae bacterium]